MKNQQKSIVLVIDHTGMGGAELALIALLKELRTQGWVIYLIVRDKGKLLEDFIKCTEQQLILPFPYPTKLVSWKNYFSFKKKASRFINEIPGKKIILVGDLYPLWASLLLKKTCKVPVYSIFQGEYVFEDDSCPRKWVKYGANRADKLIASEPICEHIKNINASNTGVIIKKPIRQLNPRVDLSCFQRDKYQKDILREELGFSLKDRLAICVGRVGVGKGQPWLIEAFLNNADIYKNWHLLIVGPINHDLGPFFDKIRNKDYLKHLHFLGLRTDVPELYAACDLALFPGMFNESFGLAVVEAAVMGLPILAFRSGSIPFNLGENYGGLFDKNQKDEYMDAWARLSSQDMEQLKGQIDIESLVKRLNYDSWKSDITKIFSE